MLGVQRAPATRAAGRRAPQQDPGDQQPGRRHQHQPYPYRARRARRPGHVTRDQCWGLCHQQSRLPNAPRFAVVLPDHHEVARDADRRPQRDVARLVRQDDSAGNRLVGPAQLELPDAAQSRVMRSRVLPGAVASHDAFDHHRLAPKVRRPLQQHPPVVNHDRRAGVPGCQRRVLHVLQQTVHARVIEVEREILHGLKGVQDLRGQFR